MSQQATVVILGIMGRSPLAGVTWQALQYVEGFRRLGHDVYYVEDTGEWPYDPEQNTVTGDCTYTINYIARNMAWCGLGDHWAYRAASQNGRIYGLTESQFDGLLGRADVMVNVTGSTEPREEYLRIPIRIYLETDPGMPQIEVAKDHQYTLNFLKAHTHRFTYAENLGSPDCGLPVGPFEYHPTRPPIVLDWWVQPEGRRPSANGRDKGSGRFTTISNWKQSGKDIEWDGEIYTWSKHVEFLKFIDLPRHIEQPIELALACSDPQVFQLLKSHGWGVVEADCLSRDILSYRDYIVRSLGEFTVAKDQNIRLRSGWFSDRSASYLAAGRPVVTQETGFSKFLPTGAGLFGFTTMAEAREALEAIAGDYGRHSQGAREVAREYLAAERVIGDLLRRAGL